MGSGRNKPRVKSKNSNQGAVSLGKDSVMQNARIEFRTEGLSTREGSRKVRRMVSNGWGKVGGGCSSGGGGSSVVLL